MNHFYEIALTLIKGIGKIRIRNLISIYMAVLNRYLVEKASIPEFRDSAI